MKYYQPDVYFTSEIEDKNREKFMEVVTLSLTRGATFLVTIAGLNFNALINTSTTINCISETFIINLCYHGC